MLNAVLPLQYWVTYVFLRDTMEEIGSAMGVVLLLYFLAFLNGIVK